MALNPALLRSHCSVDLLEGLDVAQPVYWGTMMSQTMASRYYFSLLIELCFLHENLFAVVNTL